MTGSESPTDPFSSRRTSIEPVECIDMTQDDIPIEGSPDVVSSLEAKASGKRSGKLLSEDELKLYLLMLQPVQDLLEQQKIKITQLEMEIEGLRARKMQVFKTKSDKDVQGKRKRAAGE